MVSFIWDVTIAMKSYCKDCVVREKGIFFNLLKNQKDKIACIMTMNKYSKRQILFLEGNTSHYIYAIKSGVVKIFKTAEDGKTHILRVLNSGDLLAFDAVYSEKYSYSTEAIENSEICMMRKKDFISLLKKDVDLAIDIIKILTLELEETRCFIRDFIARTANQKVARFLLSQPPIFFSNDTIKRNITLPLSRKEISEMLGLTSETVSRTLSQFERDNIVKINGKKILILNSRKLSSI